MMYNVAPAPPQHTVRGSKRHTGIMGGADAAAQIITQSGLDAAYQLPLDASHGLGTPCARCPARCSLRAPPAAGASSRPPRAPTFPPPARRFYLRRSIRRTMSRRVLARYQMRNDAQIASSIPRKSDLIRIRSGEAASSVSPSSFPASLLRTPRPLRCRNYSSARPCRRPRCRPRSP